MLSAYSGIEEILGKESKGAKHYLAATLVLALFKPTALIVNIIKMYTL